MRLIHPLASALTALAAGAVLAGCGPTAPTPNPAPPSAPASGPESAPASESANPAPSGPSTATATPAGTGRCHTAALSAKLGKRVALGSVGQGYLPLIYTNVSGRSCLLRGVPGLDLRGPADPNGPVYSLYRQDRGGSVTLAPGASASARVVVLSDTGDGSYGSNHSTNWTPTELVTIPPGETTPLTVPWPAGVSVLRQDEATHPGSWIESFTK
ncbi:MAG TPA: DUF4232 domain-containing protein [Pseudonocardia sp.]|jgi:hypothetical protein